jgi:hypothetical protein
MRTILMSATFIALGAHGGHALAQNDQFWQNPPDQMPYHGQEYSAPVDPSFQPQPHVYERPSVTTICTRGTSGTGKRSQFFCN